MSRPGTGRIISVCGALALFCSPLGFASDSGAAPSQDKPFRHIATFDVLDGNGSSVAEIVDVAPSGTRLAYTDGEAGEVGFVNIANPWQPRGDGVVAVGGEPTSLAIVGDYVLVAVNTSPSFVMPSGNLVVLSLRTRAVLAEHDLGGQPDAIAIAPDGERAAIVIENERDEDLGGGFLPQAPSGGLLILTLSGDPSGWTLTPADLSPVAASAFEGGDLEPEYVDVNAANLAVVSFQENNHFAVVDLTTGLVVNDFPGGSVALDNVDSEEEDLINLNTSLLKRREADAVAWLDEDSFASANEGDYEDMAGEEGGARGFTVFNVSGAIEFESAESFEHQLVSIGHYNEGRSENKGVEPESVEYGSFGAHELLFVGSERSNVVGVYEVSGPRPRLQQLLPTGVGPEGLKVIPARDLFVVATEEFELADTGIPAMINIYKRLPIPENGRPKYPTIQSRRDANGLPIPWVALSGLAGDPDDGRFVYAVSDSFLAEGFVYQINVRQRPVRIIDRWQVTGASEDLDLEGIAIAEDGYWWLASEGNSSSRPNLVLKVDPSNGAVVAEYELPAGLSANRRGNGLEGIAVTGSAGNEVVYVAIQRAWPDAGDTDQVNTKIGRLDVATASWGFVHYPLEPQGAGDWIGLSELTYLPNGHFAVIERDKGWGPSTGFIAELKSLYEIDLTSAEFRPYDDPQGLVTIGKTLLLDLLPRLAGRSIWTAEKLEGFAVGRDGKMYAVTDNDGVDDATGETLFLRLGTMPQ